MARNVIIAVDFSDTSQAAMRAGGALAKDLGAKVVLVHAFSAPPRIPDPGRDHTPDPITAVRLEIEMDEAVELSTKWADELRGMGLEVETVARPGGAHDVVLEEAHRHGAGLIVVGTHGWTGLKRFVMGSVAEAIVRGAETPVLVVPAPAT